jgi:2,3-dihydroxybiphenyl 1,2-dioxygenase
MTNTTASVSQLGYMGIGVSDAPSWERFATEVVGLEIAERGGDGTLFLRMDDYHHRITIHPGGKDDVARVGWEVPDAQTMHAIAQQLADGGTAVTAGTDAEAQLRRVVQLIKFRDPNGVASEVFYGPLMATRRFMPPRPIAGFKAGAMGLGHFVMFVDDLEKSRKFYAEALGLRVTDYIGYDIQPGFPIKLVFMHCNERHHSIAMLAIPHAPKRLNHIMLELNSVDDVGATYYLCQDRKVPIVRTIGRHTNDHMMSFYMQTPSGFDIEYGWGGRIVDDRSWQVQSYNSGSAWGHRGALVRD